MRYGIFADVHGNLSALQAVVDVLRADHVEQFVCVGDIVGYGANPQECIDLLQSIKAICVAGNHDWAVTGNLDLIYFNHEAREAILWTKNHISSQAMVFLRNLKLTFKNHDLMLVHSTLPNPEEFNYLSSISQAEHMYSLMEKDICFVGHTHIPKISVHSAGDISYLDFLDTKMTPHKKYIVNPGSVGQPRDENPMAACCIFESEEKIISIQRVNYDVHEAQKRILQAGLPPFLASRLAEGH